MIKFLFHFRRLIFPHQHPDAALRYLPIVSLIKRYGWGHDSILEIGSGSYGITPYLGLPVTGVDLDFSEPATPLLTPVKGNAAHLPFSDASFSVVILSDVLEHLSPPLRPRALTEALRVARTAVIISGPFGSQAFTQDQELATLSLNWSGTVHPFFLDHLRLGLPDLSTIITTISRHPKILSIQVVGSYLNLSVRKWLMGWFLRPGKFYYYFYLKGLMLFVPLLRLLNSPPCYRQLILVRLCLPDISNPSG